MATRIALEHDIEAPVAQAAAQLADREVMKRRLDLEPAMNARVVEFTVEGDPPSSIVCVTDADLPREWMPGGLPADFTIRRTDSWHAVEDGLAGELSLQVNGLPVHCSGPLALKTFQHGSYLALTLDLSVDLPLVGQNVERLIRDRMEPVLAAELALLAAAAEAAG